MGIYILWGKRQVNQSFRFMSLYSQRHVKIRLTRREGLWPCVFLFVKAFWGAEPWCVGPNTWTTAFQPLLLLFKANLPLLQRELLHCARAAKQTPSQYLAQHEHLLLNTSIASPADSSELLMEVHGNGKRPSPERWVEKSLVVLAFLESLWAFPVLVKEREFDYRGSL